MKKLMWLFGCPLFLDDVAQESWLLPGSSDLLLEVGPRQVSPLRQLLPGSGTRFLLNILPTPSASIPLPPPLVILRFVFHLLHPTPCLESHAYAVPMWEDVFED